MPWNNENGGGQPKGPWGSGPQGGTPGGVRPPDFETLLRKFWDDLRRYVPPGALGKRGAWALVIFGLSVWLLLGVYTVNAQEQGVVLRFGAFVKHTGPGTYWHLPWPIERAYTPNVKKVNQVDIGFKPAPDRGSQAETVDVEDESYMLTGDENIVDMQFTVNWRIKDANAFLFNVDLGGNSGGDTVKAVAESSMREVVGQDRIDLIMTSHREEIQIRVKRLMQSILDSYNAGIEISSVKMQKAETPQQVRGAYLDVQKALADQDRLRNEAEAYENRIVPQARGEAARIVQEAQGYKQQQIASARGEAQRFNSIYQEYKKAPEVTRRRLYIETMTEVLGPMNKIVVDDAVKGMVPYLQLPQAPQSTGKPAPSAEPKPTVTVSEGAAEGGAK